MAGGAGLLCRMRKVTTATQRHKGSGPSQDVAAQILVLDDIGQHFLNVGRVDADGFLFEIRALERNLVEELFHDRMEAPCPDVLRGFVDGGCEASDFLYRLIVEGKLDAFSFERSDVLLDERVLDPRQESLAS